MIPAAGAHYTRAERLHAVGPRVPQRNLHVKDLNALGPAELSRVSAAKSVAGALHHSSDKSLADLARTYIRALA